MCVQQNEARLCEENSRLEQEKQSLQVELQLMKEEQQLAKVQGFSISGHSSSWLDVV